MRSNYPGLSWSGLDKKANIGVKDPDELLALWNGQFKDLHRGKNKSDPVHCTSTVGRVLRGVLYYQSLHPCDLKPLALAHLGLRREFLCQSSSKNGHMLWMIPREANIGCRSFTLIWFIHDISEMNGHFSSPTPKIIILYNEIMLRRYYITIYIELGWERPSLSGWLRWRGEAIQEASRCS